MPSESLIAPTRDAAQTDIGEAFIAKAEAMIPILRERAPEDDRSGSIRKQTIDDLKAAGLTRAVQPRRYGGYEQPLGVMLQIEMALGRGDQSASWDYAVTQGHAHHLSMFDDRAQQDVWGENPDALIASPYNPVGHATPYKDGYKFGGRWRFSSCCDHCQWFLLGSFVDKDPSKYLTFLVPREDVTIINDWDVFGLKGTGSKSVEVKDAYVPAYRTVPFGFGTEDFEFPGFKVNKAPALRIPYILVFNRSITATSIGGLAGMIDAVAEYLAPKVSVVTGQASAVNPDTLLAVGEAKATLEELKIMTLHDVNTLERLAVEGRMPNELDLMPYRYRAQAVNERCAEAARKLFEEVGGGGIYENLPIGRIYRNLAVARNHPAASVFKDTARALAMGLLQAAKRG